MLQRLASPSGFGRHAGPLTPGGGRIELAPSSRLDPVADEADPITQMAQADAADAGLLRLVVYAASATLALALLSSLL